MSFPIIIQGLLPPPGSIDESFEQGSGFNNTVQGLAELNDSYYFLGDNGNTYFSIYNGLSSINASKVNPILKLNITSGLPDGNSLIKGNFNSSLGNPDTFVLGGGSFFNCGGFTQYDIVPSRHIIKLNADDMSVEATNTGTGFSNTSFNNIGYSNDKIFCHSLFSITYNGSTSSRLQVINTADLTTDTTLTNFFLPNSTITCIFEQTDGKTVISGSFTTIGGTTQNRIVRYNTDRTVDSTFTTNVGTGPSTGALVIRQLSNGKLVLGGAFTSFNGTSTQRVVILNTDGTIDTAVAAGFSNGQVNDIRIDGSDNIYCAGTFTTFNSNTRQRLAKLSSSLVLDGTFICDCNNTVLDVYIEGTNLYVLGLFTTAKTVTVGSFFSCDLTNGDVNNTFSGGFNETTVGQMEGDNGFLYLNIRNITTYGLLSLFGGQTITGVVTVNKNGVLNSVDSNFSNIVRGLLQNGSEYYVYGSFNYKGVTERIIRYVSGVKDDTFVPPTIADIRHAIYDNGVVLVGNFTSPNNRLLKLDTDGNVDATFNVGTGTNATTNRITKLSSGKYLIHGAYTTYKGSGQVAMMVLDSTGTLDSSFVVGTSLNTGHSSKSLELSTGNYLVYGNMTSYKSIACNRAIILEPDGDQVAWLSDNFNAIVNKAVEHNGKVYFVGNFTTFGATTVNRIACIDLATGTLVDIFGTGFNGNANDCVIDSDGKLVVVGAFTEYNGTPVGRVVRINI